jgi:hypothetical protein
MMRRLLAHKRRALIAAGCIVLIAVAVGAIIVLTSKDDPKDNKPNTTTSAPMSDPDAAAITRDDVKTPTDNKELRDTLDKDAAAMERDLKNYENGDYDEGTLTDTSLYQ